ncbi:Ger(x)C family spore germination protein [Cohnella sp.]|uniref:Ger(x)C family spore germination protein n=1 Tax=Cohnella sp. TaxID=1883426 RepID=UPI003563DA96
MHRLAKWLWMVCIAMLLTGCWDRVESEERGFVVGAAIDTAVEKKLKLTFQFVVTSAFQGKGEGGKQGGDAFLNVSMEGHTLFKALRDMSTQTSRSPYLQHNRIILVSEEMARKGDLGKALDLFIRDHEMRRITKVMIAEGEASPILGIKPSYEKLPVLYIDSIAENPYKSSKILSPTIIGKVYGFLLGKASFAIPRIAKMKDKVEVAGAAIFKGSNKRMVGFLNENETMGLNFFTGKIKGGGLELKLNNQYVVFEIKGSKRTLDADVSDPEHPVFNINIFTEGNVAESSTSLDFLDPKVIAEVQAKTVEKIKSLTEDTVEKLQKDYKTDALGLGTFLKQEHYRAWQKIEKDWDQGNNLFSKCVIRVHVKVKMRIIGAIIETEK